MITKRKKTECSGMEWGVFLTLIDRLKKDQEYKFLLLIAIGCYAGLRAGDILRLRWRDILNTDQLDLVEKKTSKNRQITINDNLKDIIQYCQQHLITKNPGQDNQTAYVFGNRLGKPISIQHVNRKLHTVFSKYKIRVQNPSSHTLRKTFGMRCYELYNKSPEALVLLSEIFSHSSVAITRQYIGLSQAVIQNVYASL